MPDFGITAGDTDATIYMRLRDTSGLPQPGLLFNSAGAVASYTLPRAARQAIILATLASPSAAHSDGGFVEVDGVNAKGLYRLDLPDAAVASGGYTVISLEFDGVIEESMLVTLKQATTPISQILNVQPVLPASVDLADTALVRIGLILLNALDDLPTTVEITPGTISIDRKAIGGASWVSVVADAAMSEQAGMAYFDEVFDSGTGYAEGDSIRVTFKSISITADGNTHEVCDANGIIYQTEIRQSMRGTDSAVLAVTVGSPVNADISADIAATKADTAAILVDTADIQPKIGTPAADVSADIAAVKSDSAAILADTSNMQPKIGTPVSTVSGDIASVQADTNDLQLRLPSSLTGGRMNANVEAIDNDTSALQDFKASVATIVRGTAITGTLSQTQMTTDLTEDSDDHYNGRIIIWTSGPLKDQATDITDYIGATKALIYSIVTEAPLNGDTFVIV